jgi:plastocyanin
VKGRGSTIRGLIAIGVALAALGLVGIATAANGRGAHASATKRVSVRDDLFVAKSVTIRSGDRVKWTWRDSNDHNVTFRKVPKGASKKPRAKTRSSGTFTRKFTKRGTYRYVCTIHEGSGMTGSVKVK